MRLGESESLTSDFYLSVTARTTVFTGLTMGCTLHVAGKANDPSDKQTTCKLLGDSLPGSVTSKVAE